MTQGAPQHSALRCDAPELAHAVSYVLDNPGKQLRAQLARASCALLGGATRGGIDTVAQAIEWLHSYSLVHDDLPAMDDDDLRRGRATVHKAYNEATAILVGDGLQAAAFAAIARESSLSSDQRVELVGVIAEAVGFGGMVGGQALDMAGENSVLSVDALQQVHRQKTGALIRAAVVAGAICAGGTKGDQQRLDRFADLIGLAFQVTDDILDVTRSSEQLGKTAGKDQNANKSTYVSCLGLDGAQAEADRLLNDALKQLEGYGERAEPLRQLAARMVKRDM